MVKITSGESNNLSMNDSYKSRGKYNSHSLLKYKMRWMDLERKKIYVKTKDGRVYSGIVEEIFENENIFFMRITDKFNKIVIIATNEIISLNEESKSKYSLNKTS